MSTTDDLTPSAPDWGLLCELYAQGCAVRVEGDRLLVRHPERVTDDQRQRIALHRQALLERCARAEADRPVLDEQGNRIYLPYVRVE